MKIAFVVAPLLLAVTAHAQAPGDYEDVAPPGMTPVAPAPAAPPVEAPRRWSVGLGIGSLSVAPHSAPDAESKFAIGQLAVRYRATRHLEIELALSGGNEQLEDGNEGDRDVSVGVLALRYRFAPERRWNWWLMAGMGGFTIAHQDATKEERDAASQSTLQFGAGLERRWTRFALQAELRAVGVKANEDEAMTVKVDAQPTPPGGMPLPPSYTSTTADGWAGAQFTLSGNYYF